MRILRSGWVVTWVVVGAGAVGCVGGSGGHGGTPARDGGAIAPDGGQDGRDSGTTEPPPPCAETCDGCCDGEVCHEGTTNAACGVAGAACVACSEPDVCDSGECGVGVTSMWDVVLIDATVPARNTRGELWDVAGLPDARVTLRANDSTMSIANTSDARDNTLTPMWNVPLLMNLAWRALSLEVVVNDSDDLRDDLIASCSHVVTEAEVSGDPIVVTCPADADASPPEAGASVTIRVVPHSP